MTPAGKTSSSKMKFRQQRIVSLSSILANRSAFWHAWAAFSESNFRQQNEATCTQGDGSWTEERCFGNILCTKTETWNSGRIARTACDPGRSSEALWKGCFRQQNTCDNCDDEPDTRKEEVLCTKVCKNKACNLRPPVQVIGQCILFVPNLMLLPAPGPCGQPGT